MRKIIYSLLLTICTLQAMGQSRLRYVDAVLRHDIAIWDTEVSPAIDSYQRRNDSLLANYARECHDIRLTLYSCENLGFFDLTHELHRAIRVYKHLDKLARPENEVILSYEREVLRMQYLLETLRRMPPELDEIEEVSDSIASLESDTLMHILVHRGHMDEHGLIVKSNEDQSFYMLSPEQQLVRDSCVTIARYYIQVLSAGVELLKNDAEDFARLRDEFHSTYDYAYKRFQDLTRDIYFNGTQVSLSTIVKAPAEYLRNTWYDCKYKFSSSNDKYTLVEFYVVLGQTFGALLLAILITVLIKRLTYRWRKQLIRLHRNTHIVANTLYMFILMICLVLDVHILHLPLISLNSTVFAVYFGYILTLQISLLFRGAGQEAANGIRMYVPSIMCGFFLIFMHMYFIPDSLLCLIMIPLTVGCWIWQMIIVMTGWNLCRTVDSTIGALTMLIFLLTAILAAIGHSLLSLQIIFWWEAQQASIVIIAALYYLIKNFGDTHIHERVTAYWQKKNGFSEEEQTAIQITWLYDLIKQVILPMLSILSVPACIYMSLSFFNAQEDFLHTYRQTFFSLGTEDQKICDLSIDKLLWLPTLYFVFNYVRYIIICIYRQTSIHLERKRSGQKQLHTNQLNLTLGTNLINLLVWGMYVVVCSIMLKIPLTALTVIIGAFTGGIGFAMKDVVNNIIYGTQLMAGRLRVGDYIICDNYRGAVSSISYQTTQIVTEEGALVSFTNTALFSKNFQNLTRHNPYEVNRVTVDVAYGSDIDMVEHLIREAITPLNQKDKFGRMLLSPQEGLRIEMREVADSSITMAVRFGVIAEKRTWFLPVARKAIYKKLVENGIQIPFPQVDIHMIENKKPN